MTTAVNGTKPMMLKQSQTKLDKVERGPDEVVQGGRGRDRTRSIKSRRLWCKAAEPAF
jgi:hypothetical protein